MANEIDGIALGAVALGAAFIWSGIKGKSILQVIQNTVQGKTSAGASNANPITLPAGSLAPGEGVGVGLGGGAPPPTLTGGDNFSKISKFYLGSGVTVAGTAGILGNYKVESGLSPTAYNAGEGAIGLAQWELGRRTALQSYAAAHHGKETDLAVQLGFSVQEGIPAGVRSATDPAAAAIIWDEQFERSAGTSRDARISAARSYYKMLGGK